MLLTVLLPALLCIGQSTAKVMLPPPTRYVADYADAVDTAQEDELNGLLQQLELTTGVQHIIVTIRSTKGVPLERFAPQLAKAWRLHREGLDKMVLFVLATEEGKYRFEVGRELAGFLTPRCLAQSGYVLRQCIQAGKVSDGIYQCNLRIIQRVVSQYRVRLSDPLKSLSQQTPGNYPLASGRAWRRWGGWLLIVLLFVVLGMWWIRSSNRVTTAMEWGGFGGIAGYGDSGSYGGGCFGGGPGAFGAGFGWPGPRGKKDPG